MACDYSTFNLAAIGAGWLPTALGSPSDRQIQGPKL